MWHTNIFWWHVCSPLETHSILRNGRRFMISKFVMYYSSAYVTKRYQRFVLKIIPKKLEFSSNKQHWLGSVWMLPNNSSQVKVICCYNLLDDPRFCTLRRQWRNRFFRKINSAYKSKACPNNYLDWCRSLRKQVLNLQKKLTMKTLLLVRTFFIIKFVIKNYKNLFWVKITKTVVQ